MEANSEPTLKGICKLANKKKLRRVESKSPKALASLD